MSTALFWFRRDLRLHDQAALADACAAHERVLPLCFDDEDGPHPAGAAAHAWRHRAIDALAGRIRAAGGSLLRPQGDPAEVLIRLARATGAAALYASRNPEPWQAKHEARLTRILHEAGHPLHFGPANLLFAPGEINKADGTPYRVFTPFWRACLQQLRVEPRQPDLLRLAAWPTDMLTRWHAPGDTAAAWERRMLEHWPETPGESDGKRRLNHFLDSGLPSYDTDRDRPGVDATSQLSPRLHTGEIGIRELTTAVVAKREDEGTRAFLRQLGWREFGHQLLHAFPYTPDSPLDARFERFPWQPDQNLLRTWQRGETGIPIIDAGMRQLWQTGWMHNRVRMLVASLLTKNLLQPWQAGAAWFMETLVDADVANNTLGWQWVAGCGADAAPYFRIFNPVTQGERFDPQGAYVRHWLPELARLPERWLHKPWLAPAHILADAGIRPGHDYPHPLCDLLQSRRRALAAFQRIKGGRR